MIVSSLGAEPLGQGEIYRKIYGVGNIGRSRMVIKIAKCRSDEENRNGRAAVGRWLQAMWGESSD